MTRGRGLPGAPDNEYGWEKLYAERMAQAYGRRYGMIVRIARFQNCYGPEGTWSGGREKAPAAMCRKIAEAAGRRHDRGVGRRHRDALLHLRRRHGRRHLTADALRPRGRREHRLPRVRVGRRAGAARGRGRGQADPHRARRRSGRRAVAQLQQRAHRRRSAGGRRSRRARASRTYPWIKAQVEAARAVGVWRPSSSGAARGQFFTRVATNCSVANSPTLRVKAISSPFISAPCTRCASAAPIASNVSTKDTSSPVTVALEEIGLAGLTHALERGLAGQLLALRLEVERVLLRPTCVSKAAVHFPLTSAASSGAAARARMRARNKVAVLRASSSRSRGPRRAVSDVGSGVYSRRVNAVRNALSLAARPPARRAGSCATTSAALAATLSAVKPYFSITTLSGAEAPKRSSMPTIAPNGPTYFCQPVRHAGLDRDARAGPPAAGPRRGTPAAGASNSSQRGHADDAGVMPAAASCARASTAQRAPRSRWR